MVLLVRKYEGGKAGGRQTVPELGSEGDQRVNAYLTPALVKGTEQGGRKCRGDMRREKRKVSKFET